jgi:hypothetical protein
MKDDVKGAACLVRAQRTLHGVAASLPNMKKVRAHQIPIDLTNDYKVIRTRLTQAEPKGRVKLPLDSTTLAGAGLNRRKPP